MYTEPSDVLAVLLDLLEERAEDPRQWIADRLIGATYGGTEPITVGRLFEDLRGHPEAPVRFVDGSHPGRVDSWRGQYECLAVGHGGEPTTAGELARRVASVQAVQGYKGGTYYISSHTEVWCDNWSEYTNNPITGVHFIGGVVYLCTARKPGSYSS